MAPEIREYRPDDQGAVVHLSLRAWEPVFTSVRAVLGDDLDGLLHDGDWRASQQKAVEAALVNESMSVWVAEDGGDWMRDQGMRVAMISTGGDPGHAPARSTYEKAGFQALPGVQYFKALV